VPLGESKSDFESGRRDRQEARPHEEFTNGRTIPGDIERRFQPVRVCRKHHFEEWKDKGYARRPHRPGLGQGPPRMAGVPRDPEGNRLSPLGQDRFFLQTWPSTSPTIGAAPLPNGSKGVSHDERSRASGRRTRSLAPDSPTTPTGGCTRTPTTSPGREAPTCKVRALRGSVRASVG